MADQDFFRTVYAYAKSRGLHYSSVRQAVRDERLRAYMKDNKLFVNEAEADIVFEKTLGIVITEYGKKMLQSCKPMPDSRIYNPNDYAIYSTIGHDENGLEVVVKTGYRDFRSS